MAPLVRPTALLLLRLPAQVVASTAYTKSSRRIFPMGSVTPLYGLACMSIHSYVINSSHVRSKASFCRRIPRFAQDSISTVLQQIARLHQLSVQVNFSSNFGLAVKKSQRKIWWQFPL